MKNKPLFSLLLLLMLTLSISLALPGKVLAQGPIPPDINGDQVVVGNVFTLSQGQVLNGDLAVMGGSAELEINSVVNGNIAIVGGSIEISGRVNGDISAVGGQIHLTQNAVISGDIIAPAGVLLQDPGARVDGEIITQQNIPWREMPINPETYNPTPNWFRHGMDLVGNILGGIFTSLALAALALVLALLFARPMQTVAHTIATEPVLSGGAGLLTLLITPLILVLLAITIILLPVTIIGLLVLGIALTLGWVGLGLELGNRLAVLFKSQWATPVAAGVGTLVLTLLSYMLNFLPCCGWIVNLVLGAIGLGAVILSRFGSMPYQPGASSSTGPRPVAPVIVAAEPTRIPEPTPQGENHESA